MVETCSDRATIRKLWIVIKERGLETPGKRQAERSCAEICCWADIHGNIDVLISFICFFRA